METKRELLQRFLKGLETGDAMAAAVVNEKKYMQHNPQTHEGSEGIADLFARLSKTSPKVTFKRVFEDGDFAFAHIEYDFSSLRAAFEVFRFEDGKAVEHWDNIQPLRGPNLSGRGMQDGHAVIADLQKTEENRAISSLFVKDVLIKRRFERLADFVAEDLKQHNPDMADGILALKGVLEGKNEGEPVFVYAQLHRVLAEGNFVLCVCEGQRSGVHSSFYDLYRWEAGRIVEHWSTIEDVPPREEWKNDNGKF
ncbi:nuclear transport factor 2 family protein [Ruegeria sp. 6PALISEP08]|uniref:nuclear transport factor 2 family protein n=1 Tax=Ruegeria sp. 6PALISEP08 TaxID=1225660 RepID=UPI00067E9ADF|nr:nuclear transport factor 2 family protein [Ruegeria sp. 6PALISEP08]